jgi:hypothetical protein
MDTERRVVLYGDTVVLAGVGRALSAYPNLHVTSLDPSQATALADLDSLCPCTVILDLTVITPESAVAITRGRPDMLLIGLEPGGERVVVLSGEQARGLTTEGLVRLIETGVPLAGKANGRVGRSRGRPLDTLRRQQVRP